MPYQWSAERERRMLLLAISSANLRPSAETWTAVAKQLGEGLTASAVSQKYYKLLKDKPSSTPSTPTPSTPTKRKASPDVEKKNTPPSKRVRRLEREHLDGVPFSDISSSPMEVKSEDAATDAVNPYSNYQAPFNVPFSDVSTRPTEGKSEDMATNAIDQFPNYPATFMSTDYFLAVNSQFKVEGSGKASDPTNFLG